MHRYLFGILLLQVVTLAIAALNFLGGSTGTHDAANGATGEVSNDAASALGNDIDLSLILRIAIPCILLAVTTAFWFASIGRSASEKTISRIKDDHARDREKIQVNAEKAKTKIVEETQKEINRQSRRASGKANIKVALAFSATAAAGLVLIITELVTLGMMTMMTASGALGGYLMRGRRERPPMVLNPSEVPPKAPEDSITGYERAVVDAPVIIEHSGNPRISVNAGKRTKLLNSIKKK